MLERRSRPLERAFELADTGAYGTRGQIARAMSREGYSIGELEQLHGPTLSRQLAARCRAAKVAK